MSKSDASQKKIEELRLMIDRRITGSNIGQHRIFPQAEHNLGGNLEGERTVNEGARNIAINQNDKTNQAIHSTAMNQVNQVFPDQKDISWSFIGKGGRPVPEKQPRRMTKTRNSVDVPDDNALVVMKGVPINVSKLDIIQFLGQNNICSH